MTTVPAGPSVSRASVTTAFRRPSRWTLAGAVLAAWIVLSFALHGRWTLTIGGAELTWLHRALNDVNDWVLDNRNSNPIFTYLFNAIRNFVDVVANFITGLIAQPTGSRPVPQIGWLGVVALVTYAAGALGNLRVALLTAAGFLFLGLQGLWQESMDTLALTITAVLFAVAIGLPIGIWAGVSDRVNRAVTPVLDFMQIMPSFVYLAPLTLFFLIGPASAAIATLIYAIPPTIRYTAHGIRSVPATAVEASRSLGATGRQRLLTVQLPMARRLIVVGVNQTIMAALAMVTISALIGAPGLGATVLQALTTLDVGVAFNAGLAIVVIAVVLDRVTTAVNTRVRTTGAAPSTRARRLRRGVLGGTGVLALVAVYFSRTYLWAAEFPTALGAGGDGTEIRVGDDISRVTSEVTDWITLHLAGVTGSIKDTVTTVLIDPLQALLAGSPWWVVVLAVVALSFLVGGARTAVTSAVCLGLVIATGLWSDSMTTLASALVAMVVTLVLGLLVGVWMGRSGRVDAVVRPVLDGAQTMPAFVYLIPFVALFAASRFTAIAAAVLYAAPVTIKVVADSIRAVPTTTVEAATAAGSNTWQIITKVQLPMARPGLVLAVNQGLCYVLAMVVVGGLVGAGALGYDVVAGFAQRQLYGKGLAAGLAIVILGILLDRVTRAAAADRRAVAPSTPTARRTPPAIGTPDAAAATVDLTPRISSPTPAQEASR